MLIRGLARNPAAPDEVLLRLLDGWQEEARHGLRRRRELPGAVQDAMLRHPQRRVRAALAGHPAVDARARERLLDDPDWRVRWCAFGRPGQAPLADDVLMRVLGEIDRMTHDALFTPRELFEELYQAMRYDRRLLVLAAGHPRPGVRRFAAQAAGRLAGEEFAGLLHDEADEVRLAAEESVAASTKVMGPADLPAQHCHAFWMVLHNPLSRELVDHVLGSGDVEAVGAVADNPTTPADVVERLFDHPAVQVRRALAGRADLDARQLARLAVDPAVEVRTEVSTHRGLSEQQRAGIDIDVRVAWGDGHFGSVDTLCPGIPYRDDRVPSLADALAWARSVNPLLRRRAARNPDLPAEVAAALAGDEDLGVRVLLAQHHPDAPGELLLRCFLEYHCCGRQRLSDLPAFPTAGLSRFAGHPDPAVRRLVARDPAVDPSIVDRLTADPDPAVRRAMAECPRLPVRRVLALLDDPDLAEPAAANPALPVEEMRRIAGL